jgi:hypothetical protein
MCQETANGRQGNVKLNSKPVASEGFIKQINPKSQAPNNK